MLFVTRIWQRSGTRAVDIELGRLRSIALIATALGIGAATIAEASSPPQVGPQVSDIHIDHKDPRRIYVLASGGLFRSDNGGDDWWQMRDGISPMFAFALAMAPANGDVVYVLNRKAPLHHLELRNGSAVTPWRISRSADGGTTWRDSELPVNDPGSSSRSLEHDDQFTSSQVIIAPRHPDHVVVRLSNGKRSVLARSFDGGGTWSISRHDFEFRSIAFDSSIDQLLWAATSGGVLRSDDAGIVWTRTPSQPEERSRNPLTFVASAPDGRIFVRNAALQVSADHGQTWTRVREGCGHPVFAPNSPGTMLITCGARPRPLISIDYSEQFRSDDGGTSWQRVSGYTYRGVADCPGSSLPGAWYPVSGAFDPRDPQTVYLGWVSGGIYRSRDGGHCFERADRGLRDPAPLADMWEREITYSYWYANPLTQAVFRRDTETAKWLLRDLDFRQRVSNEPHWSTAIASAVAMGDAPTLRLLLTHGPPLNRERRKLVDKWLLQSGGALGEAADTANSSILKLLLHAGFSPRVSKDSPRPEPLFRAATGQSRNPPRSVGPAERLIAVRTLLNAGADVRALRRPETFRYISGHGIDYARALIQLGAVPDVGTRVHSSLLNAVNRCSIETYDFLRSLKVQPGSGDPLLSTASYCKGRNGIELIARLLDAGVDPRGTPSDGPFLWNAVHSNREAAALLIRRGTPADVLHSTTGTTPLHAAVRAGDFELIALMVENRANIDVQDGIGDTALHAAVRHYVSASHPPNASIKLRASEMIKFLVHRGANKVARNKADHRPVDLIQLPPTNEQDPIRELLQ